MSPISGQHEGDTVTVMDWDSHRYLECYFAVPMIGAVLHILNIRLSPVLSFNQPHGGGIFVETRQWDDG